LQRWNGCLGLTTTDCLRRLGIFHLPKLKIITIGNLSVKPPQRSDLNQLASLILGPIQNTVQVLAGGPICRKWGWGYGGGRLDEKQGIT